MTMTQAPSIIRVGVFEDVAGAERAVSGLLGAGFRHDQIAVLCSDDQKEQYFRQFESEEPGGSHTPAAAATGSFLGGLLGGLVSAGVSTLAGVPFIAAGPSFIVGGAVLGGFIGAMQTRGQEGALTDFYEQALSQGKLLVAVHEGEPASEARLAQAEAVLRDAGALPIPLEDPSGPLPPPK